MTKKQFLGNCSGMECTDVKRLASVVLSAKEADRVCNAINAAMNAADIKAREFYVYGYRLVFNGLTVEAYGNPKNNYAAYVNIEL